MKYRRVALLVLVIVGIVVTALLVVWSRFDRATVTTLAAIVAIAVALAQALPGLLKGDRRDDAGSLDRAAGRLAVAVRKQWTAERRRRGLDDVSHMAITWSTEDGRRQGELRELIDEFVEQPGRLVVTGERGSGKSAFAVFLTVAMLARSSPSHPIPVLLQASSWDPGEALYDWVAKRLREDYEWLAEYDQDVVVQLTAQLLPVLDGLDEMPADRRADALVALHEATALGDPLVVTCRSAEFLEADAEFARLTGTRGFPATLVAGLQPLDVSAVVGYLNGSYDGNGRQRSDDPNGWEPVAEQLRDNPDGPLATVLSRPLMLFLARSVYSNDIGTATELLDEQFSYTRDIEAHLLDKFVPKVFEVGPAPRTPNPSGPQRQWDPETVRRTLTHLACLLSDHGTTELAWWRIQQSVPPVVFLVVRTVVGGMVAGVLGAVVFGLFGAPLFGFLFWLVAGALAGAGFGIHAPDSPRRLTIRLTTTGRTVRAGRADVVTGMLGGLGAGLIVGFVDKPLSGVISGLLAALLLPSVMLLVRRSIVPAESSDAISPSSTLAADRAAVGFAAIIGCASGLVVGAVVGWAVSGRIDRFAVPLDNGWQAVLLMTILGGVVNTIGLGLIVLAKSAWGRFVTTRWWLAITVGTPLALMSFLQDAYRAGTLRQAGAYYQFRHVLLQERLVERADESGPA